MNFERISQILGEPDDIFTQFASEFPILQTSNFGHATFADLKDALNGKDRAYLYTRGMNPTVEKVERKIAKLEFGEAAKLFASGAAGIAASTMAFLKSGDHVVCVNDCYSWTKSLFSQYLFRFGIETTFIDGDCPEEWESAIRPSTKLFYIESPTTFSMKIQDISSVSALAKRYGIKTIVDNTWATPIFQNPIKLGADIVVHSCSKHISGHSDVIAGVVVGSKTDIDLIHGTEYLNIGATISPFEAWLILRGMKTLLLRMSEHKRVALEFVAFLNQTHGVSSIYPLVPAHPQYNLAVRQMTGGSSLLTVNVQDANAVSIQRLIDSLRLFKRSIGWGGTDSLVLPMAATPRCPPEQLGLIRLYLGLQPARALFEDFANAVEVSR